MDPQEVLIDILIRARDEATAVMAATSAEVKSLGDATQSTNARLVDGAGLASTAMLAAGAAIGIVDIAAIKWASDFEDQLAKVRGNTGLTSAAIDQIRTETLKLGAQGPAALGDILMGFEHVANEGFTVAQSTQIVHAAWEGAIATGSKVADVANLLGVVMHNMSIPTSEAASTLGVLMQVAASGNMRLADLVEHFSKIGVTAAAIHMPLADIGALFSALTRSTGDAALAQTQLEGALVHIISPTKAAQTVMAQLHQATGIDLAGDFQKLSAGTISVTKVMEDARAATHGNAQEIMALFGGIRGGLSMLTLLGDGWQSYLEVTKKTHDANALLQTEFANMSKTVSFTMGEASHAAQELGIAIGDVLIPPLDTVLKDAVPVAMGLTRIAQAAPLVTGSLTIAGAGFLALGLGIKATMALAGPYQLLWARIAGTNAVAAASITATGVAAAAATPEVAGLGVAGGVLSTGLAALGAQALTTDGLIAALDVELATLPEAETAAAASTGLLAGAMGLLMSPEFAIPAVIIAGGVLAYETMPAVRESVNSAARTIGTDLTGALYVAEDALNNARSALGQHTVDTKSAGSAANDLAGSLLKVGGATVLFATGLGALIPVGMAANSFLSDQVKQHDAAAAAAKRHADALRGLRAEEVANDQARASEGGKGVKTPIVSEAAAATDFSKVLKAASAAQSEAMAAYADGLTFTSANLHQLASAAAATTKANDDLKDKMIEAGIKTDLLMGRADAGVQNFVSSLKSKATDSLELFAVGLQRNASNLSQLEQSAIRTARAEKAYEEELARATKVVNAVVPPFQTTAQQVAAAGKAAAVFASTISKAATDTAEALAKGIYKGDSGPALDRLTAAAAKAEMAHLHMASSTEAAQLRIARASGDWASVLSITQKQMQDAVNAAVGKFVSDQRSGNTAALPGDRAAVTDAEAKLKKLTDTVSGLEGKATTLAGTLASLSDSAAKKAKDALDALALGIEEHQPTKVLDALREKAQSAADGSDKFTTALATATGEIQKSIGFSGQQQAADARTKTALDAYALALMDHARDVGSLRAAYIAAGTESAKFAADLALAGEALTKSLSGDAKLQKERSDDQARLGNAIAAGVVDIQQHGQVSAAHAAQIERDRKALALLEGQITAVTNLDIPVTFAALQQAADTLSSDALDKLAKAIFTGSGNIAWLAQEAGQAALISQQYAAVLLQAKELVAIAAGDFSSLLTDLSDAIKKAIDKLATDTYTGAANSPLPLTPEQVRGNRLSQSEGTGTVYQPGANGTVGDQDLQGIITAEQNYQKALAADTTALYKAAAVTGEWAPALNSAEQQTKDTLNNGTAEYVSAVLGLGGSTKDATALIVQGAQEQEKQDLATAEAARVVATAMIGAALAAGDYAAVAKGTIAQDQTDYGTAISYLTGKILSQAAITQGDIDAAQAHRIAVEADTQATWDATYAASSLAEKHNMLVQVVSGLISNFNTMAGATASVQAAQAAVLAQDSQIQIGLLQDIVTNTADETAIITAQSGVSKAIGDGVLAGIKDQAGIITAQGALDAAMLAEKLNPGPGNEAAIAVARDGLTIARQTAMNDAQTAQWAAVISRDNLRTALDKAASDRTNEAWQHVVEMDKLKVMVDTQQLTIDQVKLTGDTLPFLATIASSVADVGQFVAQTNADLASIGADQAQIGSDNQQLASDTASAAAATQAGLLQQALDAQQLARDQAAADASSLAGQERLAEDANRLAADQVASAAATAANTGTTNTLLQRQLDDANAKADSLQSALRAVLSGVYNPHVSDLQALLDGYPAEAHASGGLQ